MHFCEQSDLAHFEGDLDSLCRTFGFAGHFECSAKKFEGIDKAVKAMVKKVPRVLLYPSSANFVTCRYWKVVRKYHQ